MIPQNDLLIVQRVLAGEAAAYALLVDAYKDGAVATAYAILLNREDAEEVAQDAFLKAYTALHTFKGTARFSTWLYRIVVNTALNRQALKHYIIAPLEVVQDMPASVETAFGDGVQEAHRHRIRHALATLSTKERLCISLFYLNELSVEEVRQLTGLSISNIKVLLHRGRKVLYDKLYDYVKEEFNHLIPA